LHKQNLPAAEMPVLEKSSNMHHTVLLCSLLGSAVALTKQSGELVAVAHPQQTTGFKNPCSYGAKPVFSSET
jgi:hypothetical protein